jgi:hypothetical protein
VATWKSLGERWQLALLDPWAAGSAGETGAKAEGPIKPVWQREYAAGAHLWLIDGEEAAVLDAEGNLEIVALPGGAKVLKAQVDPQPKLEGIYVQRWSGGYVLAAKEPVVQNQMFFGNPYGTVGMIPVSGQVFGIDRQSGKKLWSAKLDNQAVKWNQPSDLPVLAFFNFVQKVENNQVRASMELVCLDKRNGRILHQKKLSNNQSYYLEVAADPEKATVEVRSGLGTAKMTFTGDPEK